MTCPPRESRSLLTQSLIAPALALAALLSTPSQAAALLEGDSFRVFGTFDLGVGGVMTPEEANIDLDLSPSFGGTLGFDVGVGDFFAIGLMGTSMSLKLSDDVAADLAANVEADVMMDIMTGGMVMVDPGASAQSAVEEGRSSILDFALYPRLRLPLPIMELYVMVPVGYATYSPDKGDSMSGYSVGVFGGLGMSLLPILSLLVEGGMAMYFLDGATISEPRINAGVAIGF